MNYPITKLTFWQKNDPIRILPHFFHFPFLFWVGLTELPFRGKIIQGAKGKGRFEDLFCMQPKNFKQSTFNLANKLAKSSHLKVCTYSTSEDARMGATWVSKPVIDLSQAPHIKHMVAWTKMKPELSSPGPSLIQTQALHFSLFQLMSGLQKWRKGRKVAPHLWSVI